MAFSLVGLAEALRAAEPTLGTDRLQERLRG